MSDADDPYFKSALAVIRLIAFALILISFFLYVSDAYLYFAHRPLPATLSLVAHGLPFLIAIVLFVKSRALAERLTRNLD